MNKIYIVHQISGLPIDTVFNYYKTTQDALTAVGYNVLTAMYGKNMLRCEKEFKASNMDKLPCTTNHAIFQRDRWMVKQADIIYANFLAANQISIGSMMELAWASDNGKHIVVAMQENNVHRHAFVLEAASVVYTTHEDALDYLTALINKRY